MAIKAVTTGNPYKITGTTNTNDKVTDNPNTYIKFIYWYNPTTVGHLLSVKDQEGNEIVPLYLAQNWIRSQDDHREQT